MTKRFAWRRIVWAFGLFTVLGGPSPGAVGSCSKTVPIADAYTFCIDEHEWICARDALRGDLLTAGDRATCMMMTTAAAQSACLNNTVISRRTECLSQVAEHCTGFIMWPSTCSPPNEIEAQSCIDALKAEARLNESSASIYECLDTTLCPPTASSSSSLSSEGSAP